MLKKIAVCAFGLFISLKAIAEANQPIIDTLQKQIQMVNSNIPKAIALQNKAFNLQLYKLQQSIQKQFNLLTQQMQQLQHETTLRLNQLQKQIEQNHKK